MRCQISRITLLALTAALAACTEEAERHPDLPAVAGVYDMTVDFSAYETFDIVEPDQLPDGGSPPISLIEANRIAVLNSIAEELEARGYVRDQVSPDLEITTFVRYHDVEVVAESTYWYDYYYGWYWGYGYPWYDVDLIELEAGTLVIDAVDVGRLAEESDDMLVFRGTATGLLPDQPVDFSAQIPGVIADIFDFWPGERTSSR